MVCIYWYDQKKSEVTDTVKCKQNTAQDLFLFKYIQEQDKESFDGFLETNAGRWSSEVSICFMSPCEIHMRLQDRIPTSVDQLKHGFAEKKLLALHLRSGNPHRALSN